MTPGAGGGCSMSFRYPDHPNTNRTDPFQDADGKNPFADGEATPEKAADNPYAASPANEPGFASADPYQVVYPHRGRSVFWLGVVGCCCALGAVLAGGGSLSDAVRRDRFLGDALSLAPHRIPDGRRYGLDVRPSGSESHPGWSHGLSGHENDSARTPVGTRQHADLDRDVGRSRSRVRATVIFQQERNSGLSYCPGCGYVGTYGVRC